MNESCINDIPFFDNKSFFKKDEKVYIQLSTEFPKFVGVTHKHQFIEIVYILSGSAIHTVGEKKYTVKRGDVVVINCGIPHKFSHSIDNDETFVAYDLMFTPDFFDAENINMSEFEALKNNFLFFSLFPSEEYAYPDMHILGKKYSDYGELFTRIYNEYRGREKGFMQLIRAYVIELIIKIFRDVENNEKDNLSVNKKEMVNKAIKYIEENYNAKIMLDDVASNVFLGSDYFRKLFKKATGNSVIAFQQKLRIDKACQLLLTTEKTIKEIASSVGYNDMTTFYQTFKKITGCTPREYQNHK